jgi:putative FmdB family regulatory protein
VPTYQYACTACDERLEVVQKFTDDPLTECAACGGRLRKVFSPVGIVFKGSGFYRTDSRNGSQAGGKEKADGAAAASDKPAGEKAGGDKAGDGKAAGEAAKPAAGETGTPKASGDGKNAAKPAKVA